MEDDVQTQSTLDRRLLLRGGAVLAGAAGVTVIGAALATPEAKAADGEGLVLGKANTASNETTLTRSASRTSAALSLTNTTGPALRLTPVGDDFEGPLRPGDIVSTNFGPVVGVDYGDGGPSADYLATWADLDALPTPVAIPPERLLDTRTAAGRANIVGGSVSNPLTSAGKLRAGQWIDVAVSETDQGLLSAVFANVTVVSPEGNGFLVVYAPASRRPATSTVNYRTGESLANAAFVGLNTEDGLYVVRIYTAQTSHVLFDLSGFVTGAALPATAAAQKASTTNRRTQRQAKQADRLRNSLRTTR